MNAMPALPPGYSLRIAGTAEFPVIRRFYDCLIDDLLQQPYHPLWDKEGHPADSYLLDALAAGELWIAEHPDDGIVAGLIVNHSANDGYLTVPWRVKASADEVAVVHAFGIHTRHQGRGLGSAIMRCVIDTARLRGDKAVRLDLIDFNLPVQRVYLKLGFEKCAEVKLYYDEVGWQLFHMFEYAL